jgi:hypothetical protein
VLRYGRARAWPEVEGVGKTAAAECRIAQGGDYTYIEQNTTKKSPWTRLAKRGHQIWWEFHKSNLLALKILPAIYSSAIDRHLVVR